MREGRRRTQLDHVSNHPHDQKAHAHGLGDLDELALVRCKFLSAFLYFCHLVFSLLRHLVSSSSCLGTSRWETSRWDDRSSQRASLAAREGMCREWRAEVDRRTLCASVQELCAILEKVARDLGELFDLIHCYSESSALCLLEKRTILEYLLTIIELVKE